MKKMQDRAVSITVKRMSARLMIRSGKVVVCMPQIENIHMKSIFRLCYYSVMSIAC